MARPIKDVRFKLNGKSLQVYKEGAYLGSISVKILCQMATEQRSKGTGEFLAQPEFK